MEALSLDSEVEQEVKSILLSQIEQNENSRVIYKASDLSELIQSMKDRGLLQAVGVRKLESGKYEAVYGNRRIVAARKLGWKSISARIMDIETDVDRDVVGLIENIKRQNTTPSEDGRMFQSLMDRGLSIEEVSARVGISRERVTLALEVFNDVPKEYHKLIKNRISGSGKKREGEISASSANKILTIRRKYALTKSQTKQLLDFAKEEDVATVKLDHIGPLLKSGSSVRDAIKISTALARVCVYIFADERHIKRLEKKYDCSYTELIWETLEKNKELGIVRNAGHGSRNKKLTTVARASIER